MTDDPLKEAAEGTGRVIRGIVLMGAGALLVIMLLIVALFLG